MKNSEPFFRSGKWCKDKSNILNHQIFQELFRKLFSRLLFEPASVGTFATFVSRLRRTVFVIADAKVGIISKRANIFELFLSFFSKKLLFGPIYLLYVRLVVVISSRRTPRPHAMGPRHRPDGRRKMCRRHQNNRAHGDKKLSSAVRPPSKKSPHEEIHCS